MFDRFDQIFPTRGYGWIEGEGLLDLRKESSSFFGFVLRGPTRLHSAGSSYELNSGQYFSIQRQVELEGGAGVVFERGDYNALNLVGGPVETVGRLKYIDGCTDTLLVPPVKRGDACLNALFFPEDIDQTLHTHPSIRLGLVARGRGECRTQTAVVPLLPGNVFLIEEDAVHGFHTTADTGMLIIAYHPDSDFGAVDEDHPMINRTIVGGVSASVLDEIRTR
jgi:quercetin dioxygenase-like cupin family protein